MVRIRQSLVHTAVFVTFFLLTIAALWATHKEPPLPRMLLIPGTLVQIEVPYGLLPHLDLFDPPFKMDGHRFDWIVEAHAGTLALTFTGQPPQAWPDPQPMRQIDEPAARFRNQTAYSREQPMRVYSLY